VLGIMLPNISKTGYRLCGMWGTYWSIRKKTSQPDESDGTSISKVLPETGRNIRHDKPKKQGANRKFTQLSLFPKSKQ
jgi:hypothetical protein